MDKLRRGEMYSVKLTVSECFISTFKALVGIGILSCPYAFKEVGLYGGIVGVIIVVIVNNIMYN